MSAWTFISDYFFYPEEEELVISEPTNYRHVSHVNAELEWQVLYVNISNQIGKQLILFNS